MAGYVVKGGRPLRLGYTTGSCATAAAAAAAEMLLGGQILEQVLITLPSGDAVTFSLEDVEIGPGRASCSVVKDAGDDPDVTDGIKIFAECLLPRAGEKGEEDGLAVSSGTVARSGLEGLDITLLGGEGVGIVMADGLSVPKGEPAINPVPRKMIAHNVRAVCKRFGRTGGLSVCISAPGGIAAAKKTFNPRLGIEGGISILGTTGIVEPMSEKAIVDTIKLLIDKRWLADPENILITPGNYGRDHCRKVLGLELEQAVKYSNFLGECLDYLVYKGFKRILLVGHAGKLIKAAGGIMNTHSAVADCRMEIIAAHAASVGAGQASVQAIMRSRTTDEALDILFGCGLAEPICAGMLAKLMEHLRHRLDYRMQDGRSGPEIGAIVFSQDKTIMQSGNAAELAKFFLGENA